MFSFSSKKNHFWPTVQRRVIAAKSRPTKDPINHMEQSRFFGDWHYFTGAEEHKMDPPRNLPKTWAWSSN